MLKHNNSIKIRKEDRAQQYQYNDCKQCQIVKIIKSIIEKHGFKIAQKTNANDNYKELFDCLFCKTNKNPHVCKMSMKEFCSTMKFLIKSEYSIHSSLWIYDPNADESKHFNAPVLKILNKHILYIKINTFIFHENTKGNIMQIPKIKAMIKKCDDFFLTKTYDSIIIDVRGNMGGSNDVMCRFLKYAYCSPDDQYPTKMWIFKYNANKTEHIIQSRGILRSVTESTFNQTSSINRTIPICILINRGTQSAGEFCVSPFVGKKNVTFIGEQSGGMLTGNQFYFINHSCDKYTVSQLPNNKTILSFNLTVSEAYQSNGKEFEQNSIQPDINSNKALELAIKRLT